MVLMVDNDPVTAAVAALQQTLFQEQTEKLAAATAQVAELKALIAVREQEALIAQATLDQMTAFAAWQANTHPATVVSPATVEAQPL